MSKVGIVIINYNTVNCLKLTMKSLLNAITEIPFAVGIIDNGSVKKEREGCKKLVEDLQNEYPNKEIKFFDAGKNLGFSGGNNVVIKYFLKKEEVTHICLLNADVIVTDHWLEYLLEKDKDVIGPVTNAAGNEQTIQVDYDVKMDDSAIEEVNIYAEKRHIFYKDYVVESELITFFATVLKREVIEKVGLLDEQFYPGSYEDDDYCVRILNAGYRIHIARDCFLHHFGSGSFSKLSMTERKNIGNVNRRRFEEKWNCKWQDRTWKLLESCKQDMDYILKKSDQGWAQKQLDISLTEIERLLADWGEAILFFSAQAEKIDAPVYDYSIVQLLGMLAFRLKRRVKLTIGAIEKKKDALLRGHVNKKDSKAAMVKIYQMIRQAKSNHQNAICVFAPMYDRENEKDGYMQRIKSIDTAVLKDMCRIYLCDEGIDCVAMRFDFIDALHGYIVFNSHNEDHLCEVIKLAEICGMTYTHSILRFMEDRTSKKLWRIFELSGVKHFWDMHGAVPEEYELSGSESGSRLAGHIEAFMADRVDVVVVVTEAMGRYLKQKYPDMQAEVVIVPIFNKQLLTPAMCKKQNLEDGISIVYAGGMQPWQNIRLIQDLISATGQMFHYKMFVPDKEEFWKLWGNRPRNIEITVESKSPEDLYKEYENCDFGLALRDSCPVNYVACPTKIIEYLRFGIIPVLKSTEIGDFIDLGMRYISYESLWSGVRLTNEERDSMVSDNYEVLSKLMRRYLCGIDKLQKLIGEL